MSATGSGGWTRARTITWSSRSACSSWPRGCGRWPGGTTGHDPSILAEGDLRLDPAAKRAWRAGAELQLSPKEFSLLEFFLRHPGRVLTRSQIIEAVWDFAYDGGSNVVDQYVNYLRRKIGLDDIETVRGMGYRLRDERRRVTNMPIRLRLAVAFAVIAAAVFALGGWLFASGLASAQLNAIDSQLIGAARTGRALPPGRQRGWPGPVRDGQPAARRVRHPGHRLGRVTSGGRAADAGSVPLLTAAELRQARLNRISVTQTVDEENARVAAAPLGGHPGWVAVAGVSLETYESTQSQVKRELAVGGAVFVAVAGLGAYWLARAALSPVERLRRQVAAISARDEESAVQVPATRDEIAALAGTMNELLGRLQRALARQRAFVADASHELRTPLAVLRGELELAGRPGRGWDDLAAAVRSAAAETERLARITDGLLLLARGDEERLGLRLERADIGHLLARSAGAAGSRLDAAGVTCRVDMPAGSCAVVDRGPDPRGGRQPGRQRAAVRAARIRHRTGGAGGTAPISASRSATAVPVSPPGSCRTRSSGSGARTAGVPVTTEALALDWPSSVPSPRARRGRRRRATSRVAEPSFAAAARCRWSMLTGLGSAALGGRESQKIAKDVRALMRPLTVSSSPRTHPRISSH